MICFNTTASQLLSIQSIKPVDTSSAGGEQCSVFVPYHLRRLFLLCVKENRQIQKNFIQPKLDNFFHASQWIDKGR